jgi:hypothetical protein
VSLWCFMSSSIFFDVPLIVLAIAILFAPQVLDASFNVSSFIGKRLKIHR